MRRIRTFVALAIFLTLVSFCAGQETLTNESVMKMVKSGLGEDLIISMIGSQATAFSLKSDDLISLKQAGVSEKVLGAMLKKGTGMATPNPAVTDPAPKAGAGAGPVSEVGVYYFKNDAWLELMPEVVNWKTGGVLKSVATVGVVKGDVNGRIAGPHAKTAVTDPIRILIYAPEGTAITEYQLLRLREKDNAREFRTVTGGVFHVSGGANRDLLPFEHKKTAPRTYEVILPAGIGKGEFGILPPGGSMASGASSQLGKIYSFRVPE
jgi:hypothetical protein